MVLTYASNRAEEKETVKKKISEQFNSGPEKHFIHGALLLIPYM